MNVIRVITQAQRSAFWVGLCSVLAAPAMAGGSGSVAAAETRSVEEALTAATGLPVISRTEVAGPVGPRYLGPGRATLCGPEAPPSDARLPPELRTALAKDRGSPRPEHDLAFSPSSVKLVMAPATRDRSVIAYITLLRAGESALAESYYGAILADCSVGKTVDIRFFVDGAHVQLTDSCSTSISDLASVMSRLDTALHPRWLVAAPCGDFAFVNETLLRTARVSVSFDYYFDDTESR